MSGTINRTDKYFKEEGNRLFSLGKYKDAVSCYSKAIIKNPDVPTYYTNRALCYLKMKDWMASYMDCQKSLDIDKNLVKGHFFLGLALVEMDRHDEAVKRLQRADELAKIQNLDFRNDIAIQLKAARKRRWTVQEEKTLKKELYLQSNLDRLIREDIDRQIKKLRQETEDGNAEEVQNEISELELKRNSTMGEVNSMFAKIDDARRKRDIPNHLCGTISFELLSDPVITPSGMTYDRKTIEEHLNKVGHFDPVTRAHLTKDQLIPNRSMQDAVNGFLEENEWALDC